MSNSTFENNFNNNKTEENKMKKFKEYFKVQNNAQTSYEREREQQEKKLAEWIKTETQKMRGFQMYNHEIDKTKRITISWESMKSEYGRYLFEIEEKEYYSILTRKWISYAPYQGKENPITVYLTRRKAMKTMKGKMLLNRYLSHKNFVTEKDITIKKDGKFYIKNEKGEEKEVAIYTINNRLYLDIRGRDILPIIGKMKINDMSKTYHYVWTASVPDSQYYFQHQGKEMTLRKTTQEAAKITKIEAVIETFEQAEGCLGMIQYRSEYTIEGWNGIGRHGWEASGCSGSGHSLTAKVEIEMYEVKGEFKFESWDKSGSRIFAYDILTELKRMGIKQIKISPKCNGGNHGLFEYPCAETECAHCGTSFCQLTGTYVPEKDVVICPTCASWVKNKDKEVTYYED